jgi:hypothetical protein
MSEYTTKNGINYRNDGYAFCGRCGRTPIVNDKCMYCDVQPTERDLALAGVLKSYCFNPRRERQPGFSDARYESFDTELAARILTAERK